MKKYLFIAEKPSLMRDIKDSYQKHKADIQAKVGQIDFIALSGHACRLMEPKEYSQWDIKWEDIDLPMVPEDFKIDMIPKMADTVKSIRNVIKSGNYDGIIVGTDGDVEGNGIYYLLANYLNITKMPALRYFADDQTDKHIFKGLMSLTDFYSHPRDVRMADSYLIRSRLDWLIGMNFTIGVSRKAGFTVRAGRVKTPTLQLVYDNCKEIEEFVPHSDFAIQANYKGGFTGNLVVEEIDLDIKVEKSDKKRNIPCTQLRFATKQEAESLIKKLPASGTVASYDVKTTKAYAPALYSLSALQAEADAKYHYEPAKVLSIVQALYETHKIVSYPRTSGRHISSAKAAEFPEFIDACFCIPGLDAYASKVTKTDMERVKKNKNIVNDTEVAKASHDALMPTGKRPEVSKLSVEELNICTMIYKQFLAHFLPALVEEKKTVLIDIDGHLFKSTGKQVLEKGWTAIYDKRLENTLIPDLKIGEAVKISFFDTIEKTTQPPKRFTQGSLVAAMVNAAKYVKDKELKEALKEAEGIGQESSRSEIIKSLIRDGYMEDKKGRNGGLYISETGKRYIDILKGYSITSPVLASEWEYKTKQIRQGLLSFKEAEQEMLLYVKNTVEEIENSIIEKSGWAGSSITGLICPVCHNKSLMKGKYGWYCSGKREGLCEFVIPQAIAKKKLTEANVRQLVEKGKTGEIKGFQSAAGKTFSAKLKLEHGKIDFAFDEAKSKSMKAAHQCPICKESIISDKWSWKCEKGCGFHLNYKVAGKELQEADLQTLINKGETKKISGFVSKTGKKFSATIKFNKDGSTRFEF